jgi:Outer membrane protein beta-barrel domain
LSVNVGVARVAVIGLLLVLSPRVARADWIFAPFIGTTFAGSTALPDLDQGASSSQFIFGGSAGLWTSGIFGFEGDFSYAPSYFESDDPFGVITSSNVFTLSGNVVIATPVSITRESLRPYIIGGIGSMHVSIEELGSLLPDLLGARNSVAMNFGGGVVGFITPRTGLRFEVRHFRSLEHGEDFLTNESESLLSFWRATVGVVIRR